MQLKIMMVTNDFSPSRKLGNIFNFFFLKKVQLKVQKDEIDLNSKNDLKSPYQQIRFFLQTCNFTIDKNKNINDEKEMNTIKEKSNFSHNFFLRFGYNNKYVLLIPNMASTNVYGDRSKVKSI